MAGTKSNSEGTATAQAPVVNWGELLAEPEEVEQGVGVTLADIPDDVKRAVEQSKGKDKALKFRFPSDEIGEQFLTYARQYASLREPKLTIRTTKVDGVGVVQFKAKDFETRTRKNTQK